MGAVVFPSSRRDECRSCGRLASAAFLLAGLLLLSASTTVQAQRKALNEVEQRLVNDAIVSGVGFLRKTQERNGGWPRRGQSHAAGYTALPGLTLLECGQAPNDPVVQKAARRIRKGGPILDATYEIALSILFLDRLGEPGDRELIQKLAVRLIAGQTVTGGWGYKCPPVSERTHSELLTALRRLQPRPPVAVRGPGGNDPLRPGVRDPNRPLDRPGRDRPGGGLEGFPERGKDGRDRSSSTPGSTLDLPQRNPGTPLAPAAPPAGGWRWRGCIKQTDPAGDEDATRAGPAAPPRIKDVVPARLQKLPVFFEGQALLIDPERRAMQGLAATTDNSNTQFATLALWVARRHAVPTDRSLRLLARRFATSQNVNGTWSYHYQFGGGLRGRDTMTCVGLLGLAVGLGLADAPPRPEVLDPALLRGFVALSGYIGDPLPPGQPVPQANLYLLWSIERVAVLYNLPTIGGKDWYRWAAQMLVANQTPAGNWQNGGYHAAHPVLDTCLALLVLKQSSLTGDLGKRLPIDPVRLERGITQGVVPTPKETTPDPTPPVPESPKVEPPAATSVPAPETSRPVTAAPPPPQEEVKSSPRRWPLWLALGLGLTTIAGGVLCLLLARRRQPAEDSDKKPRARRKPGRKAHPAPS